MAIYDHEPLESNQESDQHVLSPQEEAGFNSVLETPDQLTAQADGLYRPVFGYVHNGQVTNSRQSILSPSALHQRAGGVVEVPSLGQVDVIGDTGPTVETDIDYLIKNATEASADIAAAEGLEVSESRFSVKSAAKYLNPVRAAKAYGRFVKNSMKEFGLPEVVGTVGAMGFGYVANKYGGFGVGPTAIAGSIGENVGFYGTSYVQRYLEDRRNTETPYTRQEALVESGKYLLGSFAVAEIIDTPLRPLSMWAVPAAVAGAGANVEALGTDIDAMAGLFGGKILADHFYYGFATPSAEAYKQYADARKRGQVPEGSVATFLAGVDHLKSKYWDTPVATLLGTKVNEYATMSID